MVTRSSIALLALLTVPAACSDDAPSKDTTGDTLVDTADSAEDASDTDTTEPPAPDLAVRPAPGTVVAGIAVKDEDLIGGPKAEGQLGDLILENHVATFLVEGARKAGGYRQFGGALVDADLQPGGEDRLGELWLVWNLFVFVPDTAEVVSDGRDGLAVVRVSGRTEPYAWIQSLLGGVMLADPVDLRITYEYRLAPDSPVIELIVRLENEADTPADLSLPLMASNQGDGAFTFAPGAGLGEARGPLSWTGAIGLKRSYGFIPAPDELPTALFQATNVQIATLPTMLIPPGGTRELRYHYVVTDRGTTGVEEARAALHDIETITISGSVEGDIGFDRDEGEQPPSHTYGMSWVSVTRGADVLALSPVLPDGTFSVVVPAGEPVYIQAHAPSRGASEPVEVSASREDLNLELPALGEVIVRVRDEAGAVIPAQVDVFRENAPNPFAPAAMRFEPEWGRGRSAVLYHTEAQAKTHLLPGEYRLVGSRGYSYELDEAQITVTPGTSQTIDLVLTRAVDTTGWAAADLHLHAFWSPDADVPYPSRLRQAAANDVALPVFTEHTYMGDVEAYRPEADVDEWVRPIPGQEVSTIEYGHFNAYPLVYDATLPSGGAVFEHGRPGTELLDAIRAQNDNEFIVQINHPRISSFGQAYFNAVDLDSAALVANKPERWSLGWDMLEVFNERCGGDAGNAQTLQDWFNLNDHGVMKGLSAGSDSHSESAGLGNPRSWIPVTKGVVEDDVWALVPPLRERRHFVSCGPFVRFTTADGLPTGSLVPAADGTITFHAKVEAPTWIAVDRVRLLENGVPVVEIDLSTWERPDDAPLSVRFEGALEATPAADAWYALEVLGSGGLWPLAPSDNPYALTNVIQVDADADGQWVPPVVSGTTREKLHRQLPADAIDRPHTHHELPADAMLPAPRGQRSHGHAHPHRH